MELVRNIDIGTAEEQNERMRRFCTANGGCAKCYWGANGKNYSFRRCILEWAILPCPKVDKNGET